jgi:hypothetical protein
MTKEEYAWARFGVPLDWLAEHDNIPAPNALADAFGDRYLYRHNPVYASVRDAAVGFGYSFSSEDTPLWRDYQCLGLAVLRRILKGLTIPYFATGTTFRRLIEDKPCATLPLGFIPGNLKSNRAFHESAHCVAHSIMRGIEAELRAAAPGETDRIVLEAILAESFANTVEALGSVFEQMTVLDNLFYPLNSYYSRDPKREDLLSRAGAELGAELRFALLFFSYIEANLAMEAPDDSAYERVAEAGGCVGGHAGLVREIADTGFRLSAGFRSRTTPAYFELLGCTLEYEALANASWLCKVSNRSLARTLAPLLWKAAGSV